MGSGCRRVRRSVGARVAVARGDGSGGESGQRAIRREHAEVASGRNPMRGGEQRASVDRQNQWEWGVRRRRSFGPESSRTDVVAGRVHASVVFRFKVGVEAKMQNAKWSMSE